MISFPIDKVLLTDSVFFKKQHALKAYLTSFDLDRLMHNFRVNAGIPSSAEPLGGWEAPGCLLRGHFTGHYLAAAAKMAFALNDGECRLRAHRVVDALAECALENGYLSAFEEKWLDVLERQENYGVWAPYYTLHKIMSGLIAAYSYTDCKKALALAQNLARYIKSRFDRLPEDKIDRMLRCTALNPVNEFGGIGDSLYSLWEITKDDDILSLAKIFDRDYFAGELSRGNDVLTDLHANTHLPEIVAAMHRYHITGEKDYLAAGKNFYKFVLPRTFANGNSSSRAKNFAPGGVSERSEHWGGELDSSYLTGGESESCCAHNTEALLSRLLVHGDDKASCLAHLDSLKFNAVCNCASAETGLSQYHQPMGAHVHKSFSSLYNDFWCCTGSGVEAMASLSENIWFRDNDGVLLNSFIPSRLTLTEKNAVLSLETLYPRKNAATVTVEADDPFSLTLKFRSEAVSGVSVNGGEIPLARKNGFASFTHTYGKGDVIDITISAEFERVPLGDGDVYAVKYGNVLLALTSGDYDGSAISVTDDGRFTFCGGEFLPLCEVENEEYTVYVNSHHSKRAKDGSSAY